MSLATVRMMVTPVLLTNTNGAFTASVTELKARLDKLAVANGWSI